MNKVKSKLIEAKQWFIHFVMVRIFLISTHKRQNYLIDKHASMFLGLQNIAKKHDNNGDIRTAMYISSKSYEHLNWFTEYCRVLNIDQVKRMRQFLQLLDQRFNVGI